MNGKGNKSKNRNINRVVLEGLSVWCRQVLVVECQLPGMTRGSVRHQGTLLTKHHLATQQVRSTPK
jgi:hypothetical protein